MFDEIKSQFFLKNTSLSLCHSTMESDWELVLGFGFVLGVLEHSWKLRISSPDKKYPPS